MSVLKQIILSSAMVLLVAGCSDRRPFDGFNEGDPVMPLSQKEKLVKELQTKALEKKYTELKEGELAEAEKNYVDNPNDSGAALKYAKLLRKVKMTDQAKLILRPFAIDSKKSDEDMLLEYAKIQLELGEFDGAQIFAQEAVFMNDSPESNMILGVALDAQGHHDVAEKSLRYALNNVGLDIEMRNKILNNLALCLLAQGREVEAQETLAMVEDSSLSETQDMVVNANRALASGI